MDLSALSQIEPAALRSLLPEWLARFVDHPQAAAANRERTVPLVAAWSDATCAQVVAHLTRLGQEHRLYEAHPACREISRSWCRDVLLDSHVQGGEHLEAARRAGPVLLVGNHLSYFDANATDALLAWHGLEPAADRLVAAAGPKVYEDLFRRFAAGCIHTLPVVQSATLGHTAQLAPRELARRARQALTSAATALQEGYVVLLYPEGSRSRTGQLQPFLRGVHRWLAAVEGLQIVPLALVGTHRIMPVAAEGLRPGPVSLHLGPPLQVGRDGTSREVLARVHAAVAEQLPEALRPPPDTPATS